MIEQEENNKTQRWFLKTRWLVSSLIILILLTGFLLGYRSVFATAARHRRIVGLPGNGILRVERKGNSLSEFFERLGWESLSLDLRSITSIEIKMQLQEKIANDWLHDVCQCSELEMLYISGFQVTDRGVGEIARLQNLYELQLSNIKITDKSMKQIGKLFDLELLDLSGTNITDQGLEHLKKLTKLKFLYLEQTNIQGKGLENLSHLPISHLSMFDSSLNNNGMKSVNRFRDLKSLWIGRTRVSDEGLAFLQAPNLESLEIGMLQITGQGLKEKIQLPKLDFLMAKGSTLGDDFISILEKFPNLEYIDLDRASISKEGRARLQEKFPRLDWSLPKTEK